MPVFDSVQELDEVQGAFLREVVLDPELGPSMAASNTSFLLHYTDPDCDVVIDCTTNPPTVSVGRVGASGEIRVSLSADDGHLLWLGELNLTVAMATRRIKAKGPIVKMVKLLPAMAPAFPKYRAFLEERGLTSKLTG